MEEEHRPYQVEEGYRGCQEAVVYQEYLEAEGSSQVAEGSSLEEEVSFQVEEGSFQVEVGSTPEEEAE